MFFERKGVTISFEKQGKGCGVKLEKWYKESQESEIEITLYEDEIAKLVRWFAIQLERPEILL